MGDTTGSAVAYAQLLDNWAHADADLPALAEARRGADARKADGGSEHRRGDHEAARMVQERSARRSRATSSSRPAKARSRRSSGIMAASEIQATGNQFDGIADIFVPRGLRRLRARRGAVTTNRRASTSPSCADASRDREVKRAGDTLVARLLADRAARRSTGGSSVS